MRIRVLNGVVVAIFNDGSEYEDTIEVGELPVPDDMNKPFDYLYDGETVTIRYIEPSPPFVPEKSRIEVLEDEAAMLALELVDTQIRLDQSETDHAILLFELVDKGVL